MFLWKMTEWHQQFLQMPLTTEAIKKCQQIWENPTKEENLPLAVRKEFTSEGSQRCFCSINSHDALCRHFYSTENQTWALLSEVCIVYLVKRDILEKLRETLTRSPIPFKKGRLWTQTLPRQLVKIVLKIKGKCVKNNTCKIRENSSSLVWLKFPTSKKRQQHNLVYEAADGACLFQLPSFLLHRLTAFKNS